MEKKLHFAQKKCRQGGTDMMRLKNKVADLLIELRIKEPLVHNITNYVTVNGVANALLAIGGSPIMADDIGEVESIVSISSALVLNMGTLNQRTISSMLAAGKKANELEIPVILDPVGAGASVLRNNSVMEILENVKMSIIRGNLSEISFVAGMKVSTKGVDSAKEDGKNDSVQVAKKAAQKYGCIMAVTGVLDTITDGEKVVMLANGNHMLSKVTGTGCMTTALIAAYAGVTSDYFTAAVGGVLSMGIAGELSFEKHGVAGTGSFAVGIIDALSHLEANIIRERAIINEA